MKTRKLKIKLRILLTTVIIMLLISSVSAGDVEFVTDTLGFTDPQILIVTNRKVQSDGTNNNYFPNQISKDGSLTYLKGYFKEVRLMVSQKQDFDDLVSQNNGYKDWLVFVHGDSKTLSGAAKRALEIQNNYQVNVIVFSWPSRIEEKGGWKNFKTSKMHVEEGVDEFFNFLNQLDSWKYENQGFFAHHNLSILFHSLGNYYLERLVKEDLLNGYNQQIFDNLIVNAAAVNQKDHHLWLDQINIQERIIVNTNDQDYILKGVRLLKGWERQLGEDVKKDHASNATYVSFTDVSKSLLPFDERHGYYLGPVAIQSEAFKNYYYTIIHGEAIEKEVSINLYTKEENPVFNLKL